MKSFLQKWALPALTLFTFFFLLGSRSLNEPDEGRYSEIAREMVETGDWLVPHLWYVPHLDKPPMTYWLVAASLKLFGQSEWTARLPVALAGISGVWAAFLLGCALGGRRVGIWSALLLQSALLYFLLARMLTTDMFLTQFVAWAIYFFYRSWTCIQPSSALRPWPFFGWHLAGWIFVAFAFLTKGPIAIAIPAVAFAVLAIVRRNEISWKLLLPGVVAGLAVFSILAVPWFLAVFAREPDSAHYMILGQAAGHLLGTTIKNRPGGIFYFFGILAVGLVPWTLLLGWLWRRAHWRSLDQRSRDGWLLLNTWAIFTFALFSLSQAKLPAYILPIFPALAVMLAMRFFREEDNVSIGPRTAWLICLACAFLPPIIFPVALKVAFHDPLPTPLLWQMPVTAVLALVFLWQGRKQALESVCASTIAIALLGYLLIAAELPAFETTLRGNQTFQPVGVALRDNFQPGDAVVCWGKFPQGLPFYSGLAICASNLPYLGRMDLTQVPFEFPGNRNRIGRRYLPDAKALTPLLQGDRRVWVVAFGNTLD
ncbi:MAG TPA: glycosyltransferase family 39 protein, partial [Verrucomicrobiae bacterium]|nr:glycosyltransferase family 39 protein [Verrucomicrobiae bacterium]